MSESTHDDEVADRVLEAAFALLAERGSWAGVTVTALAQRTGLSLLDLYTHLPERAAILRHLGRRVDEAMLADLDDLEGEPTKEKLLELLLRRFEALLPYREGLRRLARPSAPDLGLAVAVSGNLDRAFGWLLAASDLPAAGPRALALKSALGVAYLRAARVWLDDDSESLAKTMAELDKRVDQALEFARTSRSLPSTSGEAA